MPTSNLRSTVFPLSIVCRPRTSPVIDTSIRRVANGREKLLDTVTIVDRSAKDYGRDATGVADVLQRVRLKEHQVCNLASFDFPHRIGKAQSLLALIGTAIGLAGALLLTRLMSSLLYGVGAADSTTFAIIVVLLMFVSLIACYLPARRATRIDPLIALRRRDDRFRRTSSSHSHSQQL